MRHIPPSAVRLRGFTLIELMIVVAVAALLLTIALPMYQDSVRKSRRSEAIAALVQLQQAQERFRANNVQYAATFAALQPPPASATANYALTIPAASASSYSLSATAQAASPQFADTKCRVLTVMIANGDIRYQSTDAVGTVDTTNANRCWPR